MAVGRTAVGHGGQNLGGVLCLLSDWCIGKADMASFPLHNLVVRVVIYLDRSGLAAEALYPAIIAGVGSQISLRAGSRGNGSCSFSLSATVATAARSAASSRPASSRSPGAPTPWDGPGVPLDRGRVERVSDIIAQAVREGALPAHGELAVGALLDDAAALAVAHVALGGRDVGGLPAVVHRMRSGQRNGGGRPGLSLARRPSWNFRVRGVLRGVSIVIALSVTIAGMVAGGGVWASSGRCSVGNSAGSSVGIHG